MRTREPTEQHMTLAQHQQYALHNHCRFAWECGLPWYAWMASPLHSIVLTVNSGYE